MTLNRFSDKPSAFIGPLAPDKYARDTTFLKKYAMERWEVINCRIFKFITLISAYSVNTFVLLYVKWVLRGIVGSLDASAVTEELGKDFRTVLENSGLVKKLVSLTIQGQYIGEFNNVNKSYNVSESVRNGCIDQCAESTEASGASLKQAFIFSYWTLHRRCGSSWYTCWTMYR
jgi:hypothetical protein